MPVRKPAAPTAPARNPRFDAYIEKAAPFAQPILRRLREWVHATCPDAAEEMKWSSPHFTLEGKMFFGFAAFKAHCTAGFWNVEVAAKVSAERANEAEAMGQLGRLTSLADLPADRTMRRWLKEAAVLVRAGEVGRPREKLPPKPDLEMPADLVRLLAANPAAHAQFDAFPPSARREYLEWIAEAKRAETRATRLQTTVEWVAAGKRRHWKYKSCVS